MSLLHDRFDADGLVRLLGAAGFEGARAWPVLGGFGIMAVAARGGGRFVDAAAPGP
jgi:hypothetical protein